MWKSVVLMSRWNHRKEGNNSKQVSHMKLLVHTWHCKQRLMEKEFSRLMSSRESKKYGLWGRSKLSPEASAQCARLSYSIINDWVCRIDKRLKTEEKKLLKLLLVPRHFFAKAQLCLRHRVCQVSWATKFSVLAPPSQLLLLHTSTQWVKSS